MIKKIIEFSAHNRILVFVVIGILSFAGLKSLNEIPLDAIPDLSDTQVIIYSKWDRSPKIIEDQVTYPIITSLLGAPKVKDIRGFSDFGFSYIYVIFEDGVDPYWARSRVLEYMNKVTPTLPQGVKTELGPDATGVGWVYQYVLKSKTKNLAELRTIQDFYIKYQLQTVKGVAEVASLGGFQKQYQIEINPIKLNSYKIPINKIIDAVKNNNNETGARLLEIAGAEYMVRAQGYIKSREDIENIVVEEFNNTPIYIKDIASVKIGPEMRRGVSDLNGEGDTAGGVVVMRYGENANRVIEDVKKKIDDIKFSLPEGVEIETVYDRSDLIKESVKTLFKELRLEVIIVSIVILLFLLHIPSASIPIVTLPLAVLISFIPMHLLGISSNIMSLGGIAIAIGAMVDAAIVVVENTHKHLEEIDNNDKEKVKHTIIESIKEVGPSSFYSLLVIAVSFIPIFVLEAQEGKLFKPLAFTKNLSMIVAALLSITLDPALRVSLSYFKPQKFKLNFLTKIYNGIFIGKMYKEEEHPISRFLHKIYSPIVDKVVEHRYKVVIGSIVLLLLSIPPFIKLGSEFMPPLNEGSILFMPTTMPGISIASASDLLKTQDQIIKNFPEVEKVYGKAGRAETSTDPAPLSMMETVILLKPQKEWREKERWYSFLPNFLQYPFTLITPKFLSYEELIAEMEAKLKIPGTSNAWTMPIRNRIDMLATGIRTPIGAKVLGSNSEEVEKVGIEIENVLSKVPGFRNVFAERIQGGFYIDIDIEREKLARFGLSIGYLQEIIQTAIGGEVVTKTIEGRERYSVNIRLQRDFRSNLTDIEDLLITNEKGAITRLKELSKIKFSYGPSMIRNENAMVSSFVYIDTDGSLDIGSFVETAKKEIQAKIKLPAGVFVSWSGQYEHMIRAKNKLFAIVPITLLIIIFLLYLNTKSWIKTSIILCAIPFSAIGAIWILYLLGYNLSIAVWVGIIALLGVDAETGIFMLLYLDLAYEKAKRENKMNTFEDLKHAIHVGAVKRARPKVMTVLCLIMALFPIMIASTTEAGADVMKRIAAPMFGGIISSFLLELIVYPAGCAIWKRRSL